MGFVTGRYLGHLLHPPTPKGGLSLGSPRSKHYISTKQISHHVQFAVPHINPLCERSLERRELHRLCHCNLILIKRGSVSYRQNTIRRFVCLWSVKTPRDRSDTFVKQIKISAESSNAKLRHFAVSKNVGCVRQMIIFHGDRYLQPKTTSNDMTKSFANISVCKRCRGTRLPRRREPWCVLNIVKRMRGSRVSEKNCSMKSPTLVNTTLR